MAGALRRVNVSVDAIITSPLLRARQSAEIIAAALTLTVQADDLAGPGLNLGRLQSLLVDRDTGGVLLVGHEPDLSGLVYHLTGGRVAMGTSCLARINLEQVEPDSGVLVWLVEPSVITPSGAEV